MGGAVVVSAEICKIADGRAGCARLHPTNGCPVMITIELAVILFMIRCVLFGVAVIRTATLARSSGVLVADSASAHLLSS